MRIPQGPVWRVRRDAVTASVKDIRRLTEAAGGIRTLRKPAVAAPLLTGVLWNPHHRGGLRRGQAESASSACLRKPYATAYSGGHHADAAWLRVCGAMRNLAEIVRYRGRFARNARRWCGEGCGDCGKNTESIRRYAESSYVRNMRRHAERAGGIRVLRIFVLRVLRSTFRMFPYTPRFFRTVGIW